MYDPQAPQFHEYIEDFNAECTTSYRDILEDVSTPGRFTGLIHFYALSTILKQPIESYYSHVHPFYRHPMFQSSSVW